MFDPGKITAYLYAKNGGKKPTINLKKEGEKLFLIVICAALALTAWFYIPALSSVLLYFLVPLTFYFLYNAYNFLKHCLYKICNKGDKAYDPNKKDLRALAITKPDDTIKATACHRYIESLPNNIHENVKDYLEGLAIQSPQKTFDLVQFIKDLDSSMKTVRESIRDKFFYTIVQLAYTNRDDASVLATAVKEIDGIVSGIKNEALLNYFDKFFTFIEIENPQERVNLIKRARMYEEISKKTPSEIQDFIDRHTTESIAPGGAIKVNSWVSSVIGARNAIQDSLVIR